VEGWAGQIQVTPRAVFDTRLGRVSTARGNYIDCDAPVKMRCLSGTKRQLAPPNSCRACTPVRWRELGQVM